MLFLCPMENLITRYLIEYLPEREMGHLATGKPCKVSHKIQPRRA